MPTGVALTDPRHQLFAAAERVLARTGAQGLTSRAVTDEAGCAKGVLHRHFADFDDFLSGLIQDRIERLASGPLVAAPGTGTVVGNLTAALTALFDPVAVGIVGLLTFRDELRARMRELRGGRGGFPLLDDAVRLLGEYLAAERELGRVAPDADVATGALMLVGAGHMVFAGRSGGPVAEAEVREVVVGAVGKTVQAPAEAGA